MHIAIPSRSTSIVYSFRSLIGYLVQVNVAMGPLEKYNDLLPPRPNGLQRAPLKIKWNACFPPLFAHTLPSCADAMQPVPMLQWQSFIGICLMR